MIRPEREVRALIIAFVATLNVTAHSPPSADLSAFGGTWKEEHRSPSGIRKYEQNPDGTMRENIDACHNSQNG